MGITGVGGSADYTTLISSLFREPGGLIHLDSLHSYAFLNFTITSSAHNRRPDS